MPKDGVVGDVDGSFPLGRALADHSDLAAPPKMQWEINSGKQRQIADSKDKRQTARTSTNCTADNRRQSG